MRLTNKDSPTHAFNPYGFAAGLVLLFFLAAFAIHFRVRPQLGSDAQIAPTTSNGN